MDEDVSLLRQYLMSGSCCAQALVKLGLSMTGRESRELTGAAAGLCLGVRGGLTCGALTGGAMVLSLYDPDLAAKEMIPRLTEWFRGYAAQKYGGTDCEVIAPEPSDRPSRCPQLVVDVWLKVREILEDEGLEIRIPR